MWIPIMPPRMDFCGRVGCPLCYQWRDPDDPPERAARSGREKIAMDLLQKPLEDLTTAQRSELDKIATKMHRDGPQCFVSPPDESPPPMPEVDIGMSSTRRMNGWLKEMRREEPPKPRVLSCDDVADRQAAREAKAKEKAAERDKRMKEVREVAEMFAQTERDKATEARVEQERKSWEEQQMIAGIDPRFLQQCYRNGMTNTEEIYRYWQMQ